MKNNLCSMMVAFLGGLLLNPTPTDAACRSDVLRQVAVLDYSSDTVLKEFKREYGGRHLHGASAELGGAIYSLETLADDLRSSVENGEDSYCLERTFRQLKSVHCAVTSLAERAHACRCLRDSIKEFGCALNRMEAIGFQMGFEAPRPHFDHRKPVYQPRHSHHNRTPSPEELIIGGILGLLSSR